MLEKLLGGLVVIANVLTEPPYSVSCGVSVVAVGSNGLLGDLSIKIETVNHNQPTKIAHSYDQKHDIWKIGKT